MSIKPADAKLTIFSDYTWPFCFIGMGIVEKLKEEFNVEVEWLGLELHPETPPRGKLLREMFPNFDPGAMMDNLNRAGEPYGITFKPFEVVANTRLALEASEFARDQGLYEATHQRLFSAYFREGENIGLKDNLLRLLGEIGVDRSLLAQALDQGTYTSRLQAVREKAREHDIMSLPTFIIDGAGGKGREKIVGARPYDAFQRCLEQMRGDV